MEPLSAKINNNHHTTNMNHNVFLCGLLTAGLLAGCESEKASSSASQAKLMAEARVSRADAEHTALARVPSGTIKEGELEKEHGRLIWSFDIATPDSNDITEVAVDAVTGAVVAVDQESPEDQAKEAAEDAAKAQKEQDKD
jgi:hypothetical protein